MCHTEARCDALPFATAVVEVPDAVSITRARRSTIASGEETCACGRFAWAQVLAYLRELFLWRSTNIRALDRSIGGHLREQILLLSFRFDIRGRLGSFPLFRSSVAYTLYSSRLML